MLIYRTEVLVLVTKLKEPDTVNTNLNSFDSAEKKTKILNEWKLSVKI